jgi:hypothetical protein
LLAVYTLAKADKISLNTKIIGDIIYYYVSKYGDKPTDYEFFRYMIKSINPKRISHNLQGSCRIV